MATPYTKQDPVWLARQDENDPNLNPNYRHAVRYYKRLYQAWPEWCSIDRGYREIYELAKFLRSQGQDVQVDHIVPINHDLVCGLHVPWNLIIMPTGSNRIKSNGYWPNMPYTQLELTYD